MLSLDLYQSKGIQTKFQTIQNNTVNGPVRTEKKSDRTERKRPKGPKKDRKKFSFAIFDLKYQSQLFCFFL